MLAEKTGWTYHYIMYRVAWINVRMMLADAPQYISGRRDERTEEATDDDLRDLANSL
ncbi:hypothetical protein [uncultured Rikenella sp.]|uniref:hypothetical protein n=1 Tax=uncultured Rikenella sp. TaxID=368003 RepID=UPI002619E78C|nr:hypothetical protein [uncultured Rikenella sp.]